MDRKHIRRIRLALLAGTFLVGALSSGPAAAQWRHGGPRVGFGIYVGAPFYPYYSPYYNPYYYPPVVVSSPPPVYIEQAPSTPGAQLSAPPQQQPQQAPVSWWYYCAGAQGYYPYVKECPGGWQKVAPQPPG